MHYQFDWDPVKERANMRSHRVSFRQAATVFRDPNQLSTSDEEHSDAEDRWVTIGFDSTGVLRVIIHTFEQVEENVCLIRMISARHATSAEERQYREAKQ